MERDFTGAGLRFEYADTKLEGGLGVLTPGTIIKSIPSVPVSNSEAARRCIGRKGGESWGDETTTWHQECYIRANKSFRAPRAAWLHLVLDWPTSPFSKSPICTTKAASELNVFMPGMILSRTQS